MEGKIRVGLIGMGYRGSYLLRLMQSMPQLIDLVGIADPNLGVDRHEGILVYGKGKDDYRRLIDTTRPDLVIIASPWAYHIEHAHYALSHSCHIALEIKPGLNSASQESEYAPLLSLMDTHGLKCFPLENALFKREVLAIKRMVEAGVLGTLIHLRGGYRHDLRHVLLDETGNPRSTGEGSWRYHYYTDYNADIYPTHGFAPLALMAGLRQREQIKTFYSQGSKRSGFVQRLNPCLPIPRLSDVITTHITTQDGVLINLIHDTSLPRPRSLDWEVQGSKGVWDGDKRRIYIDGLSPKETWEDDTHYINQYQHLYWDLWQREALEIDQHHQGMDYIMLRAMIADIQGGEPYPASLEDLILWCSITPFSALSLATEQVLKLSE